MIDIINKPIETILEQSFAKYAITLCFCASANSGDVRLMKRFVDGTL